MDNYYICIYSHTHTHIYMYKTGYPSLLHLTMSRHLVSFISYSFYCPILINDINSNILGLPLNLVVPKFIYNTLLEYRVPKRILNMNWGTTRLRGWPRNRWQDEVREDGRIVSEEGWQEKLHNREEWKKLLRTGRYRRILHMPLEWMNEWMNNNL